METSSNHSRNCSIDYATSPARSHSPNTPEESFENQPWYWGKITRAEAAAAVCQFGETGTGCYVVRQSESKFGDFVITFNYHGEAKHLRVTVRSDGRCLLENYSFPSLQSLLDNYRTTPLPLGTADVMLTKHIPRKQT